MEFDENSLILWTERENKTTRNDVKIKQQQKYHFSL